MRQFLLDTNICIFFLKGKYQLARQIKEAGEQNCFISEITVAELKYGVENSPKRDELDVVIQSFLPKFTILPVFEALDIYAQEKARLRRSGSLIGDLDILIGATAIFYNMTVVTNNVSHLSRLENSIIEDWTTAPFQQP